MSAIIPNFSSSSRICLFKSFSSSDNSRLSFILLYLPSFKSCNLFFFLSIDFCKSFNGIGFDLKRPRFFLASKISSFSFFSRSVNSLFSDCCLTIPFLKSSNSFSFLFIEISSGVNFSFGFGGNGFEGINPRFFLASKISSFNCFSLSENSLSCSLCFTIPCLKLSNSFSSLFTDCSSFVNLSPKIPSHSLVNSTLSQSVTPVSLVI